MEISLIIHSFFVLALVVGGLRAAVARDRRSLLWGGVLTTAGAVGTLWASEVSAITVLLAIIFIFFDFMAFAFSGATRLLPSRDSSVVRPGRIYAALVIWLAFALVVAAFYVIWGPGSPISAAATSDQHQLMAAVLSDLWGQQEFSLYLMVALIFGAGVGSFFMIEQEK